MESLVDIHEKLAQGEQDEMYKLAEEEAAGRIMARGFWDEFSKMAKDLTRDRSQTRAAQYGPTSSAAFTQGKMTMNLPSLPRPKEKAPSNIQMGGLESPRMTKQQRSAQKAKAYQAKAPAGARHRTKGKMDIIKGKQVVSRTAY